MTEAIKVVAEASLNVLASSRTFRAIDIGKADGLKKPKHSSGGPAITGRTEVIVLVGTKLDVLPQLC